MDRQLINSARLILSVTRKGMYVRVYGHLKAFQDKRSLNAYSLRYRFNLFFFFLMFELNHMKNIKVSIYLLVAVLSICFMLSILCMQQYSSYVVRWLHFLKMWNLPLLRSKLSMRMKAIYYLACSSHSIFVVGSRTLSCANLLAN